MKRFFNERNFHGVLWGWPPVCDFLFLMEEYVLVGVIIGPF